LGGEVRIPRALVVYYSVYGNTENAAKAIRDGLTSAGLEAECKRIQETKPEDLKAFDAIIFGTPTHMEDIPDDVRRFMESLKQVSLRGKEGSAFDTRYEDEPIGGLSRLEKYLKSYRMKIVSSGLPVLLPPGAGEGPLIKNELSKCTRFGKSIGEKILTNN
jgi:NAD(P)H dehydrogenase (quinone)